MNESVDEDLCQRLVGQRLPSVRLSSTAGGIVDLAAPSTGRTVIYCYPSTSEPGKPAPTDWDLIPGARGCTPQACTFRDHYQDLQALGAEVFGLSTQTTAYQAEMSSRLHLPFCRVERRRNALHQHTAPADLRGRWDATDQAADDHRPEANDRPRSL